LAYNGIGQFLRVYNWITDAANGIFVRDDRMDTEMDGFATGLSNCITKDGQQVLTNDIPFGGFKITGLGNGVAPQDATTFLQVFTSPAFTGTPIAPTAAVGTNSTQIATTEFANQLSYSTALPGQSLGFLGSDGTTANFTQTFTGFAAKEVKGEDIVCSATVNLTTATGNFVHLTGSTGPVTAITIPSGATYTVVIDSTPTFTYNATSLITPTGADIVATAGDTMIVTGDGGNARIVSYIRVNGQPLIAMPYLYVREQQASSTNGGTSVATDITQSRVLNTVVINTITGASLASNIVTLPSGSYQCRIRVPSADAVNQTKAFLYNTSDSTYTLIGSNGSSAVSCAYDSYIVGRFTISAQKNFRVRHWTTSAQTTTGLGTNAGTGQIEIFTECEFWKVA
jgi:hypothetical protein